MSSVAKYVFPKAVKELRFHLSQTDAASANLRAVLTKWYPALKKNNPTTPILIREASIASPVAFARFEYGREARVHLADATTQSEVEKAIRQLIESKP